MTKMGKLYAPDGALIVGTLELVTGSAGIIGATRQPDGSLDLEYEGGTEMFGDDSKTVERKGQRVFLDEDGSEWLESELLLRDD